MNVEIDGTKEVGAPGRRPRRCTAGQLKKVAVTLLDRVGLWLKCDACATTWSPNWLSGGKMRRGYWRCPYDCNVEEK